MNLAQLFRRAHVGLTLIAHDVVGNAELFEQPQHALRARIVEMMNRQHGWSPRARAFSSEVDTGSHEENASKQESCAWRGGLVPAGGGKVEMPATGDGQGDIFTRVILTYQFIRENLG